MALATFEVENYRSFAHRTRIELRPLTLLFGYNSAGKSALLRFLPIVSVGTEPNADGPLNLRRSHPARFATFRDLRCRLAQSNEEGIRFSLRWDDENNPISRIEIELLDLVAQRRQVVEKIRASGTLGSFTVQFELPESEFTGSFTQYVIKSDSSSEPIELEFDGLIPIVKSSLSEIHAELFSAIAARLRSLAAMVHWIGPLRAPPLRPLPLIGPVKRLSANGFGEGAVDMLAFHRDAHAEVSSWYERTTRHRLELISSASANEEVVHPMLSPLGAPAVQIRLADTGEGMGQVLPVIALAAMAKLGYLGLAPILAFEQPELHLHPRAHADIAEVFCNVAQRKTARLIVETHSENILLRIQLAILKNELSPECVVVYWLRQFEDGASIAERIEFDELARPAGDTWPPGVFSEDVEQLRQIMLERRRRGVK